MEGETKMNEEKMNGDVEFTIVSQPSAIRFDCPYCGEDMEVRDD